MLKYTDSRIVFREVPSEVTLAINISGCPNHCIGCHSPYLWDNIGDPLTCSSLSSLIEYNDGITCVAFMGGDGREKDLPLLFRFVKERYHLMTAWYSGRYITSCDLRYLDYYKCGPYVRGHGPLTSKETNQCFYKIDHSYEPYKLLLSLNECFHTCKV